jgi:hypothetical protein
MKFIANELKKMWKKEISMVFRNGLFLVFLALIFSCATQKSLGKNAKLVQINMSNAKPYCGGAAPTPDMQNPVMEALPNCSFVLFIQNEDDTRGKEIKLVTTDSKGLLTLELPIGKYQLWKPSKLQSFEEFIKTESPNLGKDFQYKDNECFLAWKEKPDFIFEVNSDTTLNLAYHVNCYTGSHPCLKYNGPLHP